MPDFAGKEKRGDRPAACLQYTLFLCFSLFLGELPASKGRKKEQAFLPVLCIRYENFQDSPCLHSTVPKCMPVKKPYCFLSL